MALWSQIGAPQRNPFGGRWIELLIRTWVREWGSGGPCALSEETVTQGKERERGTGSCRAGSDTKVRGVGEGEGISQVLLTEGWSLQVHIG